MFANYTNKAIHESLIEVLCLLHTKIKKLHDEFKGGINCKSAFFAIEWISYGP